MEKEFVEQKFDLRKEEKYRSANQVTLQMIPDKVRIISSYSATKWPSWARAISSSARNSANQTMRQGGVGIVAGGYKCLTWGNTRSPRY